ncbi:MAG: hypothetical protein ABSE16_06785 [Verrucomicrobiota bacterium]|jgi:hypothetical protein
MTTRNLEGQKEKIAALKPVASVDDPERIRKDEEAHYQIYLDENKSLVTGEEASADQFDKNILMLAAGAIAVSLVFLEKIAPHPQEFTLPYLRCAWGGLVASLLLTLSSFLTSQHAYRRQRIINYEIFFSDPLSKPPKRINWWARITSFLNWTSIVAFIFGLGMLVWFGFLNMKATTNAEQHNVKMSGVINEQKNETAK